MTGPPAEVLVVGVGNVDRGDDGIGPIVARRVAGLRLPGVRVVQRAEPLDLVDDCATTDVLVVVDAVRSGRPAGALVVQEVDQRPLPAWTGAGGTHAFGLAAAVELARAMGRLPRRLVLVGVEAESFRTGAALSAPVRDAIETAVRAVTSAADARLAGDG